MKGRFPANLLVSDDILNDGKITKSEGGCGEVKDFMPSKYSKFVNYNDSGSYSRYFDLDAWWEEKQREG